MNCLMKESGPMVNKEEQLRCIPKVDGVLASPELAALIPQAGHVQAVAATREVLEGLRQHLLSGAAVLPEAMAPAAIARMVCARLEEAARPRMCEVVNATGIILHTGLGRARMPAAARAALQQLSGYCNVQMNLESGTRVRREEVILELVRELTGAEDALVVNNNAAATILLLRALAPGKEVIVSRGELIEIGGSFRLPDIMRESGVVLREVGTTNKTHLRDYANAIGSETGMLLKVHQSNYRMVGFTQEVPIAELAALGHSHHLLVADDLGCGALTDLAAFGLAHEPTVRESQAAGADVTLFSTDKLMGGPQGGMLVGRAAPIQAMKSHPLYRALRVGKMTLAALQATLPLFRRPEKLPEVHPIYTMLARGLDELRRQAESLVVELRRLHSDWQLDVVQDESFLGGGALPGLPLPTCAVQVLAPPASAIDLARAFRQARPPVVPRIRENAVLLDMRTVLPEDVPMLLAALS